MHYYKFNLSAWALSTTHLSLEEEAIYFRLINYYYDTETPIPLETQSVFRRLRLSLHTEKAEEILAEFFQKTANGWEHIKCNELLAEYKKQAKKNKKNGGKGGRPKGHAASSVTQKEPSGFPDGTQVDAKDNPNYKLITNNQELITNNKIEQDQASPSMVIFHYWKAVMDKPKALLTPKREKAIKAMIKIGYSIEQIKQAIDGCLLSPFHQGKNDTKTIYDDLELICRTGEKLESFIAIKEAVPERFNDITDHLTDRSWAN